MQKQYWYAVLMITTLAAAAFFVSRDKPEYITENRTVNLYYYNPEKDKDEQGNIMCTRAGLVSVARMLPSTKTETLAQNAVKLLLVGGISPSERAQGATTEFPLEGLELVSASLHNETLKLTFNDPLHKTTGGSCRAAILWAQIEATAKQFPGITEVVFSPEDLFQP